MDDVAAMGRRVRQLRAARGLTLAGLAGLSGVSRSMLSEVERGTRTPTVVVLDRIATALGTSIARLLRDEAVQPTVLLRRGEQDVARDRSGWERRILSPVLPGVEFEFMRTTLGPGVDAGTFTAHAAGSREFVAVETGQLCLTVDDEPYLLAAGDALSYRGDCRHAFANHGETDCVYYLVMVLGEAHNDVKAGDGDG
jgi:transcriptional regulator with XRE-family HTH domain